MDPLHITEFASPKYFDKLRSLNESVAANANEGVPSTSTDNSQQPSAQSGSFTLPLGNPRPRRRRSDDNSRPDHDKRRNLELPLEPEKIQRRPGFGNSLLGFRTKISLGYKPQTSQPVVDHVHRSSNAVYVSTQQHTFTLNELFLSLPNELQVQIITPLPTATILNLRLVSREFHNLVAFNEAHIARYHVAHNVPSYALRLYPAPDPSQVNLAFLCGLWHRLHVAQKLAVAISEHTTKEIFLRDSEAKWNDFLPQHTRMRQRLMPLIFTMFHFFEKTRDLHIQHLEKHGVPLRHQAFTLNPIEKEVMDLYDDELLLKVHQVFPLVLSSFSRQLRPPSYAGRIERSFKGMLKDKPADEIYAAILAIGGLRQAERFWQTKGYNTRRAAVDSWYGFLTREPVEPIQKSKLSVFSGFSRRKDVVAEASTQPEYTPGHDPHHCSDWYCIKPGCSGARARRPSMTNTTQLLTTSLSTGPPMSPLTREQIRLLLPDLQPLQHIWTLTGEAIVLDRQIVESATKIKRNTQVLLELIKEDSTASSTDEDWTPGLSHSSRHDFENVTRNLNAFHLNE